MRVRSLLLVLAAVAVAAEEGPDVFRQQLDKARVAAFDWSAGEMTLNEAVTFTREQTRLKVRLTETAKRERGESELDLASEEELAVRAFLDRVVQPLEMGWRIRGDSVELFLASEVHDRPVMQVYEVADLVRLDAQLTVGRVIASIQSDVMAWSWAQIEGSGIVARESVLEVQAVTDVHFEIDHYLKQLRHGVRQRLSRDPRTAKIRKTLADKRVSVDWNKDTGMREVLPYLRSATGLNFVSSVRVQTELKDEHFELKANDVSVQQLLDLLTAPHGMVWDVGHGAVHLVMVGESVVRMSRLPLPKPSRSERKILDMLRFRVIDLPLSKTRFPMIVNYLTASTGVPVTLESRLHRDLDDTLVTLSVSRVTLGDALELILLQVDPHGNYVYEVTGDAIHFLKRK